MAKRKSAKIGPDDVVINCWPVLASAERQRMDPKTVVATAGILFMVGVVLFMVLLEGKVPGGVGQLIHGFRLIPLTFLPLFTKTRGTTRLILNSSGIEFQSTVGDTVLNSKKLSWSDVKAVNLSQARQTNNPLSRQLCFRSGTGNCKIPLERMTSQEWRRLVEAMQRWSKLGDLPANLLDAVNPDDATTFTQLWLEAMTAPPRRERLQPMAEGMTLRAGEFRVIRLIGGGGQGNVYLAESNSCGTIVLKEYIMPPFVDVRIRRQAFESFEHEAALLKRLSHPGIVKLFDAFIEDHRAYLVLEYVAGRTLKQVVEEGVRLSEEQARRYAEQMCEILEYLHGQSPPVVHRDFTPDNLMVGSDGTLKLIDFMVAQDQESGSGSEVVGKHHYMAPEQFRGQSTQQADVYALGCTIFFMLTGHDPEPLTESMPILEREDVTKALNDVVAQATAQQTARRFASVADLRKALHSHAPF